MNSFSALIKNISKKEWIFIIIISFLLTITISVPFLYSLSQNNELYTYNGKHSISPADISIYYSYINQVKDGNILLINQFTPEQDNLKILNIFWLGAGFFTKIFNLSPMISFHILKIILIPLLVISLYLFLNLFIKNQKLKLILICFLSFSSGLGMWFSNLNVEFNSFLKSPIDLWVSESNIFASMYHSPHFSLSWILIIFTFIFFILSFQRKKWSYSILSGISALILLQFHPYHFITIYFVALTYAIYQIASNKNFKFIIYFIILFFISVPSIIYHFFTLKDPLIYARSLQNITLSPPIIYVVLGFGIFLPLAIWGIYKIFKLKKEDKYIFLIIWFIGSLLLAYLPEFQFQRRLLQGIQLPMIILAIAPFWTLIKKYVHKTKNSYLLAIIFLPSLLILMPTTIYNISRDIHLSKIYNPNFYIEKPQKEIIDFLQEKTDYQGVVLSEDTFLMNVLPANIKTKVFLGHGHETIDFENKRTLISQFLNQEFSKEETKNFVKKYNISYILSKAELNYKFISLIETFNDYNIYQVLNQ